MLRCLFICLLISWSVDAQIRVFDTETKRPVSYATISFGNGNGLFADDEGMFVFTRELYPDVDSLYISALGYKTLQIGTRDLPKQIGLDIEADELDEVIISSPIRRSFKILKYKPFLDDDYEKCWLPTIESEIAVFIPKEDPRDQQLQRVQFPIALESIDWNQRNNKRAEKRSFSTLFKVQFYDNEEGLPGRHLTRELLVYLVTEKDGDYFEIDVDHLNLLVPDKGMFVSIQVLGYADKQGKLLPNKKYKEIKGRNGMIKIPTNFRPLLPFTDQMEDYRTFTRRAFINGNNWKAFIPNYGIESKLLDQGFANYGIGVVVKAFKD